MTCKQIGKYGVFCVGGPEYRFEGYFFEVHRYHGPIPLHKRTHDPRSTVPAGFWEMWDRFEKLNAAKRAVCAVDGNNNTKGKRDENNT